MEQDFSRQLLELKMQNQPQVQPQVQQQQLNPQNNLQDAMNKMINQHQKEQSPSDIENQILNNGLDDNEDCVSQSANAILKEYRTIVKNYIKKKGELKALQIAIKNRRNAIGDLEGKIKAFMIDNDIEILNTPFGFLSTETKKYKRYVNNKSDILKKAEQQLTPEDFQKLKQLYTEQIYVDSQKLTIIQK